MGRIARKDILISCSLFLAGLATRIPFRSHTLYAWDSTAFALGLEHYSIADHQPHPPGYILYIMLGRIFNLVFTDANTALVAISILSGASAVVAAYFFASSIFDRTTGLIAAVLLLFSPLAWFYSEVALSYELELPFAIAISWFLYQMIFNRRYAIAGSIVLGIAAGFRQDVLFFFGIFWLWGTIRAGGRTMLFSWLSLAAAVLVWMVPLMYLAGGISSYRFHSQLQYDVGVYPYSALANGFDGLVTNIRLVLEGVLLLFGPSVVFFIYAIYGTLFTKWFDERKKMVFLLLLPLPAVLVFIIFIFDPPGYLLVFGASLLTLTARAIVHAARYFGQVWERRWSVFRRQKETDSLSGTADPGSDGKRIITILKPSGIILTGLLVFTIMVNSTLFLLVDRSWFTIPLTNYTITNIFRPFSALRIRDFDGGMESVTAVIRTIDPADTLLIVPDPYDCECHDPEWRQLAYYLPEYRMIVVDTGTTVFTNLYNHKSVTADNEPVIRISPGLQNMGIVGMYPDSPSAPVPLTILSDGPFKTPVSLGKIPPDGFDLYSYRFER